VSGIAIQGWTTLMTVVLILGSAQLFVLGVIGEYLGRLYMEAKQRPLYLVEQWRPAGVSSAWSTGEGEGHAHGSATVGGQGPRGVRDRA
jgi:hypothetical protein